MTIRPSGRGRRSSGTEAPAATTPGSDSGQNGSTPSASGESGTPATSEPAPTPAPERASAPPAEPAAKVYRVEVGAPQNREESERLAADLRKGGFDARVIADGRIYRVQAGVFKQRKNAERRAAALGEKGFAATIAGGPEE